MEKFNIKEKDEFIETFKTIIDSTLEGIIIYDENKKCIQVNKIATKLLGFTQEEMISKDALSFIAPESKNLVQKVIQKEDQEAYESVLLRKDGSTFPAMLRGKNIELFGKNIRISAILDISEIKKREEEILRLARYDHLTNVPNRLMLKEVFPYISKKIKINDHYGALLFIDLDNFKIINDIKGHTIGDMFLIEAAKRLKNILNESDFLARLGGDEFLILIDTKLNNKNDAIKYINKISNKILCEIKKPYLLLEHELSLTASIGISLFKDKSNLEELMKYADTAMYRSKEKGRNKYTYFDPKLQHIIEEKAYMIEKLSKAIEKNELVLYYQKQVKTKNNISTVTGVEALIRWDSQKGLVPPGSFISVLEESGLIISIGKWILEEAIKQIKKWQNDIEKKDWTVSVNISPKQFEKDNFVKIVNAFIIKYNINPNKLRLELTENLLIENIDEALKKMNDLFYLGITLSIDDFGTGYSSLAYLKKLPIHELKIDQTFIKDILTDNNDISIVETILTIGSKFNLEIIAEGVETKEQHEILLSIGCSNFQGYLFAKPMIPSFL